MADAHVHWLRKRLQVALAAAPMVFGAPLMASCSEAGSTPDMVRKRTGGSYTVNWCGNVKTAERVKVAKVPDKMGCPGAVTASPELAKKHPKDYERLRWGHYKFDEAKTKAARTKTKAPADNPACCYSARRAGKGRPYLDDGAALKSEAHFAPLADGPAFVGLSEADAQLLAHLWTEDGLAEHASVASFARASLELMACGAPPHLLVGCHKAAADEIRHARLCFDLALRYGGSAVEPGPLPIASPRSTALVDVIRATFLEGCVGETIAALEARHAASLCQDAEVREILESIADDEADHAALAWETVAWGIKEGGEPVHRALEAEATAALRLANADDGDDGGPLPAALRKHGRLDGAELRKLTQSAWKGVILPTLARWDIAATVDLS